MARNQPEYLNNHAFLRDQWLNLDVLYAVLPPEAQWDVHAYYQPSKELGDDALAEHRAEIEHRRPELAALASAGLARMRAVHSAALKRAGNDAALLHRLIGQASHRTTSSDSNGKTISVSAVVRPEIDLASIHRLTS